MNTNRNMCAVIVLTLVTGCTTARSDWPSWRGPEQTGMSRENAVVTSWSLEGDNLLWKSDIGGRTTPVLMDGRLCAIGPVGVGVGRRERVFCLDADTGDVIWEHDFNVFHTDIVENRVGWTALVGDPETGNLYAHGTGGELFCFDRDGNIRWKWSMSEELGRISGYGGRLHTPIVDEDLVIISFLNGSWGTHARATHRYVAFDKHTGAVEWAVNPGGQHLDTTYAVPVVAVIDGVRQLIAPNADGAVYGLNARTGETLWSFAMSKRGLNTSPVVDGYRVYVTHSEENVTGTEMGSVVCLDARKRGDLHEGGVVWEKKGFTIGYCSPAIANGRLYAVNNSAKLYAFDADTGDLHWEYGLGRVGKGSPTVTADGVIYFGEQTGIFHILKDEGDRCVSLDRKEFERKGDYVDEIYGSPVVADGRVYFMTRFGTYCLGKSGRQPRSAKIPPMAPESTLPARPAVHMKITPAEITLLPGESVQLSPKFFDVLGRRVPGETPQFSVVGVKGTTTPGGEFTASQENAFSAGLVKAVSGNMQAEARVRISPPLPIVVDFESMATGSVPPGWVGAAGRTRVEDIEGNHVLRKLASKDRPSPPFMRLRSYVTPPLQAGYTTQVDFSATPKKTRRREIFPDVGLINSRYRAIVMGNPKQVRIETWSPLPRLREDVPFDWKADTWYTLKFTVDIENGQAVARAKVWERGQPEPQEWTLEVSDLFPNFEGSAGLYGYSAGTTASSDGPAIYYDNFKVTRND